MKNLFAFPCGEILRGVYPEPGVEILRFAQNDRKRRAQNDMKSAIYDRAKYKIHPVLPQERVMKRPSAAEKQQAPRPERGKLSREEVLKRMRTISQWREQTLTEFKRRYPSAFKDQA